MYTMGMPSACGGQKTTLESKVLILYAFWLHVYMHYLCFWCPWWSRDSDPFEVELQIAVNYHVDVGNQNLSEPPL